MSEEADFDVIIIGGGIAGQACAFQLLKEGVDPERILLIDRGETIGGKNMSGGILWGRELDDFDEYLNTDGNSWETSMEGIERYINNKKVGFLSEDDAFVVEGRFSSWDGVGGTEEPSQRCGWSVLRAKADAWMAERLEEAGVMVMPGIRIDQLHVEDVDHTSYAPNELTKPAEKTGSKGGQRWAIEDRPELDKKIRENSIKGIVQDGEVMTSNCVVIAEGCNSILTRSYGFDNRLKAQSKHDMILGVKEVIHLGEDVINSRFGAFAGDAERPPSGMALEAALGIYTKMATKAWEEYPDTAGMMPRCGGWIYTNRSSLSVGVVVQLDSLPQGIHTYDLFGAFKSHPYVQSLIQGGETVEYGAHLVPEYGLNRRPDRIHRDGAVVIGDAAGLVYSNGAVIQGQNYSVHSGKLAAKAIAKALEGGGLCSADDLKQYVQDLDASYVMRDLKRFKKVPKFLTDDSNYTWVPELAGTVFNRTIREIGEEKVPVQKQLRKARKELVKASKVKGIKGPTFGNIIKFGWKGRRI